MDNTKHTQYSNWTNFIDPNYKDEYWQYADDVKLSLEEKIAQITAQLVNEHTTTNPQELKKLAITVMMKELLTIQHQNCPELQKTMAIALFSELPNTKDFRNELIQLSKDSNSSIKVAIKNKIKKLFK